MKTLIRFLVVFAFTVLARAAELPSLANALKQWQPMVRAGISAASVSANGVTFEQFGQFSADDSQAPTPDTFFEIGSVTKVFTAILLADASERTLLHLDQAIGTPFAKSGVSYRQLATHTSGLPRLPPDFGGADPTNPYLEEDLATLVRSFAALAEKTTPAKSQYSNFGFAVLGHAVAGASGDSWSGLMEKRVLAPLGLKDTALSWRAVDPKRLAPGHSGTTRMANWDLNAYAPAGAVVSTARDLARFVQAVLGQIETPLKSALNETVQPMQPGASTNQKLGLAWIIEQNGGTRIAWHNGQTGGYRSFIGLNLTTRTGVVLLANEITPLEPLGFHLLTGKPLPPPPPASREPAAEALRPLIGNYPLTPAFGINVTAEGEKLFVQATGQPRVPTRRMADDRYAIQGVPAEISFERKPGSTDVAALVLHQNNQAQRAPRLAPGEAPPKFPTEIAVTATELEPLVGKYELGPGSIFTIRRESDKLFAQLTGQPSFRIFAQAKDNFFYKVVTASITFERDSTGDIAALVLHQNNRDSRAPRMK